MARIVQQNEELERATFPAKWRLIGNLSAFTPLVNNHILFADVRDVISPVRFRGNHHVCGNRLL